MARLKVAVLLSGRGSNLQALMEECAQPGAAAEIALVVSNVGGAGGLARAESAGIATTVINQKKFPNRESFEEEIHRQLTGAETQLVCLAGFMRILTAGFVANWRDRLVNIHPSLLPAYKGLDTHARIIADGGRIAGCTVHFVRPAMDDGPIIVQAAGPVAADDEPDSLAARVLEAEHRCYRLALRLIAEGRVTVTDEKVWIDGIAPPAGILVNPADG